MPSLFEVSAGKLAGPTTGGTVTQVLPLQTIKLPQPMLLLLIMVLAELRVLTW
jgi:hypothetical protein